MFSSLCRTVITAASLIALPAGLRAQAFVEHIEPPIAERGKTTRVAFVGRDMARAFDVWHSLPAGAIVAKPVESHAGRAVFDVTVAPNAPVGICGLRVATPDGLGNLHLFLVDDLPAKRGAGDSPVSLAKPVAVWGTLREGTIDRYSLEAKAGERISFEVVANRFGKDADPLVTIRDSSGRFVAERDNDPGLYFDCRFDHAFDRDGTYAIEVRDARFKGNEHRSYVLRVGRFPSSRVALPSAVGPGATEVAIGAKSEPKIRLAVSPDQLPGAFFASLKRPGDDGSAWVPLAMAEGPVAIASDDGPPTPAAIPGSLCGVLRQPGAKHVFTFKLDKGQKLFLRSETESINSPAELDLSLQDRTGKEVKKGTQAKGSSDVTLDYTANAAGDFQLVVREGLRDGGDTFAYRITTRSQSWSPQLLADVEGLAVPRGSYQAVPIEVTRSPGSTGPIRLTLLGAPAGVSLSPLEIKDAETEIVCKLSANESAPLGLHTLQIVAECDGSRTLVAAQPLVDRKYQNIDLIPLALREDQRRLPPSVTDRFALQVTPPSPYTFELPERDLTLVRYQRVPVPITLTRVPGFAAPVNFTAVGGQLAPKEEGRTRVYAEFPEAKTGDDNVAGFVQSLILSNLVKARIDVSAVGTHNGRRVTLTRSFHLDLVPAFRVKGEPAKVSVLPEETARAQLTVERVGVFDGAVTVRFNQNSGLSLPEEIVIPKGQTAIPFEVAIPADTNPRTYNLQALSSGEVAGYEEEIRASVLSIEVRKPDVPKKVPPKKDPPKKK